MISVFYGTAQSYANKKALVTKWNMKKSGQEMLQTRGNMTADISSLSKDAQKQAKINSIKGKIKSGMRLTSQELAYLKENSPDMYQKVMDIEREREVYKEKLEKCKTKDEVSKLQMETLGAIASQAQEISSNSEIPLSKKLELMETIQMRTSAIQSEHATFVASKGYAELKWEYELEREEKARKEVTKAKNIKLEQEDNEIVTKETKPSEPPPSDVLLPKEEVPPNEAPPDTTKSPPIKSPINNTSSNKNTTPSPQKTTATSPPTQNQHFTARA